MPCLLLAASLLLFSAGCGRKEQEEGSYTVYYVNSTGTKLMESKYAPKAETFEDMMDELLAQLAVPPAGYSSVMKEGVQVQSYERGIDALRIDFSEEYYDLGNTDEALLRAAVVKTISQIPGVAKIMVTVDQEQLKDAEGEPVPAMDADSFIDTKDGGINSYQYAKLSLYFPDASGGKLEREVRNFHYSSNMVLERVVLEQLIAGPKEGGMQPVLSSAAKLLGIQVKDGICTVNLDEEANKQPEGNATPGAALYSIVNSVCATCDGITGVRIEIGGEDDVLFRQEVALDQVFEPDRGYLSEEELQSETEG